jgi:hypothetical protein
VAIDESYIGAERPRRRGRGAAGKAIVEVAVEDHDGSPGRTRIARIPNVKRGTLATSCSITSPAAPRSEPHACHGDNDVGRYRLLVAWLGVKPEGLMFLGLVPPGLAVRGPV